MLRKLTSKILFTLTVCLLSTQVYSAKQDDIRIVIDVSGSMLKTDPQNLRKPALRMISDLIPTGTNAGVWTFGRYTNMEVKWGLVNDNWRKNAARGAEAIHSRGQFTNIEGALERATNGWKKPDPDTRRNLILLTDGKVDVSKDIKKNDISRNKVLTQSLPELMQNGIRVHAIALSRHTDESLLKRLALETGGSFEVADTAKQLQRIFLKMFERAAVPDTVPLVGNQFDVDNSIREMTLLVFQKEGKNTGLISPDKVEHTELKHAANIKWRNDQGYDLITVKKPSAGKWSLNTDEDPDNRVMIVTDLKLMVDDLPPYLTPDQSIDLKVELHNKNKKISKNSFLKFVDFSVQHTALDKTDKMPLKLKKSREVNDKGIYLQQISAPLVEGTHEIEVKADGRTFDRTKRYSVKVQWPVDVEVVKIEEPGVHKLKVSPRDEYIQPESLQVSAVLKLPDANQQNIDLKLELGVWEGLIRATQQDGLHQVMINIQGLNHVNDQINNDLLPYSILGVKSAEEIQLNAESEIEQAVTEDEQQVTSVDETASNEPADSNLMSSIIIISVTNVILIIIAVGAYLYIRRRNRKNEINLLDEDQDMEDIVND